jgi:hypothetical protein
MRSGSAEMVARSDGSHVSTRQRIGEELWRRFTCFRESLLNEAGMQAKMMSLYQLRQERLDRGGMAKRFGSKQYAQGACKRHAQRARHLASISFID